MTDLAKLLIIIGLVIAFVGLVILVAGRFFPWFGNLPGDIQRRPGNHAAAERMTDAAATRKIRLLFARCIIGRVMESIFPIEGVKCCISQY